VRTLVVGASGYVGSTLIPRLSLEGHEIIAVARDRERLRRALAATNASGRLTIVQGDALRGSGLRRALDGVEVAYYLIHSLERSSETSLLERERRVAESFASEASRAGVKRIVYLGGLVPAPGALSRHLASRLQVERLLLQAVPGSVALRASIIVGARSRSFRLLVRLVERMPVIALPAWRSHRTQPIDERDAIAALLAAAHAPVAGRSLDIAGPEVLTYGEMIARIGSALLVRRPALRLPFNITPLTARIAALVADEDAELVLPLMEGLEVDLLPRATHQGRELLPPKPHGFDAAVERALRDWEARESLAAR
jgi:uncharacterized protein YbjT (DUF2867 family)